MARTKIEYADLTINPIVGCSKISLGCANCYAEKFASRLAKNLVTSNKYNGVVDVNGNWTGQISKPDFSCFQKLPKIPKRIFLGSMTDIFHENVPTNWQDEIFLNLSKYPQHTFLILTKRIGRAAQYFAEKFKKKIGGIKSSAYNDRPLPNVWLGTTVCNQEEAERNIPILLGICATIRFISIEPMLGAIDLEKLNLENKGCSSLKNTKLDWVVCGGETGTNARPLNPDWVRDIRDQCINLGIPFFFKSWGEWRPMMHAENLKLKKYTFIENNNSISVYKTGAKLSGNVLDGKKWEDIPS